MAIAYDTSAQMVAYANTTSTTSVTVSSTSNRYMFLITGADVSSASFDGVSFTKLNQNTVTYNAGYNYVANTSVWGLANPSSGTKTLSVTNSHATTNEPVAVVVYTGVDPVQAESYGVNQTNGGQVTNQTDYVYTVTDNAWIATFVRGLTNYSISASTGTLRQAIGIGGYTAAIIDSNAAKTPVAQYSLASQFTSSTGWFNSVTYSIKPYLKFTLSGPASGNVGSASTNFTVTPDVAINGSITITPSGGGLSTPIVLNFSNSSTPQTFTITPTVAGTVTLTPSNSVGLNNPSSITYTANAVVPNAPTIGTATPANAQATVSFSAPAFDGGATITSYRVISTPGSFTATGSSSPLTVTGLTNGVAYTFTARATNSAGNSSESSASNSATPYVAATSFTLTGPSSGNVRSASTNFTVTPNNIFDGTITITPSGAGATDLEPIVLTFNHTSAAQTFTITPIASGAITLTPTNSGSLTNPSNLTYTANAVIPLAPEAPTASPTDGGAYVYITAPSNDGGASITSYTVTSSPGGFTANAITTGSVTIRGLTNGTSYTFTVTATNSVGTSASSSASNAVIPSESSSSFTNSGPKFNIERNVGNILSF